MDDADMVCSDLRFAEIKSALNSIGDDKALGIYDYNSHFFKKAGDIVGMTLLK